MKFVAASALAFLLALPAAAPAQVPAAASAASAITPQAALSRLLAAPAVSADWLAPSFIAQIPASKLDSYIEQYKKTLGTFLRAIPSGRADEYLAIFTNGTLPSLIALDDRGRIIELFFRVPQVFSLGSALEGLRSLPGSVSYVVTEDGKETASSGQDHPLSVGSSFKLAVLDALAAQIARGRRHWDDVVHLQNEWKSLPTGILQNWPAGSALTLETLASLMISMSDNTAADALVHILGRDAIAPYAGDNVPLLTTHDLFVLKGRDNASLLDQWRSSSIAQRRALVEQLDRMPLPNADALDTSPANADVDWSFTNRQLCDLMERVQELPLASINPGVASPADWERIAYKGGSDWGVISMTTWLVARDGKNFCVSATWNDTAAATDETTFENAYLTLIDSIRPKSGP
ncbi:MAG TPA: serine hydrolase [Verrucomicrobiae bacterium]|nr:serine hydrolase [Verrucomicrobiae bacterium]